MEETFQEKIYSLIPITEYMGIQVELLGKEKVILSAKLDKNKNHRNTAFGGSIASIGLLCGWAAIINRFEHSLIEGEVVAKDMNVEFYRPVKKDFKAICKLPEKEKWDEFINELQTFGKSKIVLESTINSGEEEAALVTGTYVCIASTFRF